MTRLLSSPQTVFPMDERFKKLPFPLKEQPVPARIRTFLLPTGSDFDERIPALHFAAGQFEEYLFILFEVFDDKPAPIPECYCSCAVLPLWYFGVEVCVFKCVVFCPDGESLDAGFCGRCFRDGEAFEDCVDLIYYPN